MNEEMAIIDEKSLPAGYVAIDIQPPSGDTLEDYRRVRLEEYASAAVFGIGSLVFGYYALGGLIENDTNAIFTLLSCYLTLGSGSLAEGSFIQGGKMSREVSRLERELQNSSGKI